MSKDWLYTARWYARNIKQQETLQGARTSAEELERYASIELGDYKDEEPDRDSNSGKDPEDVPDGLKLEPPQLNVTNINMTYRGPYSPGGEPQGMLVHFSAGRYEKGAESAIGTLRWGAERGLAFGVMDIHGVIHIARNETFTKWGYHAGTSKWNGKSGMSKYLFGLEIACAGKLSTKNEAWFGKKIPDDEVRVIAEDTENQKSGHYHKYTEAQEESIIKLALFLKQKFPKTFSFDMVLGHDEVAGPAGLGYWRKTDPGGSLSMTMPALRDKLKRLI